jgi:adhesin/invasin
MRASLRHLATFRRPLARALLLAGASSLASCGKTPTVEAAPGSLSLVQGDQQSVQGGQELPNPIVIRLLDVDGKPLAKFPVGFSIARGGGAVSPASVVTDENGEVKTKWTLGPSEVLQTLRASAGALDPLEISAFALVPTDLIIAQGNNQFAKTSAALPNQIVIRVVGENNTPMKGVAVAFQVTIGGGLISPASALTNALGEVQARWTLGPQAGTNTIVASSGRLQAVVLNAIGQ